MYEGNIQSTSNTEPINQSDIFADILFSAVNKELLAILITPSCDLEHDTNLNYLNMCAVLPFEQLFFGLIEKDKDIMLKKEQFHNGLTNTKQKQIKRLLERLVNGQYTQYQWLGKLPNKEGYWYIDFELTQCIDYKKVVETIKQKKMFKLTSPLKEAVFVRYSTHMGRVGLPGEKKEREEYVLKVIEELKNSE